MPEAAADSTSSADTKASTPEVGDLIQLIKDYARQETLDPLKGWGRYIGLGVVGAFVMGLGLVIVVLGLLRLLQTETDAFAGPASSIAAYLIALAGCLAVIGIAAWQISRRTSLRKEPKS